MCQPLIRRIHRGLGENNKIAIYQSVSLKLSLLMRPTELILDRMAPEIPIDASSKQPGVATAPGSSRRGARGHSGVGPMTPAETAEDFRFLQQMGSLIEAQNDLVKRSVITLAASRELLDKINDLLHR
jgi:hypothetical protein